MSCMSEGSPHMMIIIFLVYITEIFVGHGDFNLPDVQWDTLSSTSLTSCAFCDFVFDHSLTQLINHPTHVQGNILDLVLSSSIDCVASLTVANDNNLIATDHFTVTFQLSQQTHLTPTTTPKSLYVFDYPCKSQLWQYLVISNQLWLLPMLPKSGYRINMAHDKELHAPVHTRGQT